MLDIILWSADKQKTDGNSVAQILSEKTEVALRILSEEEALRKIQETGIRPSSSNTPLLFINADLPLKKVHIDDILSAAKEFTGDYASFSIDLGDTIISSPEVEAATLIQSFSKVQTWNTNIVVAQKHLSEEVSEESSLSAALLKMAIRAIGESSEVDWNLRNINLQEAAISSEEAQRFEFTFSDAYNAAFIQYTIASVNIEELFPNHNWSEYKEESAAACYHSLAARFIALGAIGNAEECLHYGDRLEDSPRSLALKGLIALKQGETLAAVANMVSSLQEYEKRKEKTSVHYLSFQPNDLEVINTSLQNGLSALNKRENERAAEYFTDAVFHFDTFYQDFGLL